MKSTRLIFSMLVGLALLALHAVRRLHRCPHNAAAHQPAEQRHHCCCTCDW